ncbi:MAG: hypothetical protein ACI9DM_000239 [Cyclobacteriaceae bacterium]|jgi:hypothetical protein
MKLYHSLPETIEAATGETLKPYIGHLKKSEVIAICKMSKLKYRQISILSKGLRGKTDLRGQPYKPSKWIFTQLDKNNYFN